jgi:hypothetical protein
MYSAPASHPPPLLLHLTPLLLLLAFLQELVIGLLSGHCLLTELNLSDNQLKSDGIQSLTAVLQANKLERLFLANNQLGPEGTQTIAKALDRNWNLELLDLSENQIVVNRAAFEKVRRWSTDYNTQYAQTQTAYSHSF